jgi:thioredoxin reductase
MPGVELARRFEAQIQALGVEVTRDEVQALDYSGDCFEIHTQRHTWKAQRAIIASGTQPVTFPHGLVREDARSSVFYEVAPLLEVSGCDIAIVGAGDAAFDYALNLAQRNEVILLNRGSKTVCLPLLRQRAGESEHIIYRENTRLETVQTEPHGLLLTCRDPQGELELEVDYLIGALGRTPRLDFCSPALAIQADALEEGGLLYLIGDVRRGRYRQTAIAVGDGMLAAMKITHALQEE